MTDTKTITETRVVEQEIEVVECASCECEIPKDDALPFTIGGNSGWACEYCAEDGPADFPKPEERWTREPLKDLVLLCLLMPVALGSAFDTWDHLDSYMYVYGALGGILHATLIAWVLLP